MASFEPSPFVSTFVSVVCFAAAPLQALVATPTASTASTARRETITARRRARARDLALSGEADSLGPDGIAHLGAGNSLLGGGLRRQECCAGSGSSRVADRAQPTQLEPVRGADAPLVPAPLSRENLAPRRNQAPQPNQVAPSRTVTPLRAMRLVVVRAPSSAILRKQFTELRVHSEFASQ